MNQYIVKDVLHYCNVSLEKCSQISKAKIDYYDFTFVLSGTMTYTADGKTIVLNRNDAIFLKPGTIRSREVRNEPVKFVSFNFTVMPNIELNLENFLPNCITSDIKKIISAFPQSHLSPYYHSKEKVANFLNFILFELIDVTSLKSSNLYVLKIAKYIGEHITEKMSLQSISREIGLTKEYTANIFKKETKTTLTNYINERKMLLAKELILRNEMSLGDLSAYLGYDNYNYFSRLFKRHFGITPTNFKMKNL